MLLTAVACNVGISRHIDATHSCPLDRSPFTLESLRPSPTTEAALKAVHIRCKFGCARQEDGTWVAMPTQRAEGGAEAKACANSRWCSAIIPLGQRLLHEKTFSYSYAQNESMGDVHGDG